VKRSVQVAAAAVFLGLLGALLASLASAAEEPLFYAVHPAELPASESALRLADLPPGFVVTPESAECFEPRHPSENFGIYEQREHIPPTPTEAFERANGSPALCSIGFERLYTVPGTGATPLSVDSLSMVAPSPAAAAKAIALGPELFEYNLFTGNFKADGPSPALGEEARRWATNRGAAPGLRNLPGVLLVWRRGAVVSAIYAVSTTYAVAEAGAAEAATAQEAQVLAPRPYLAAEGEDLATFLGNPNIKVPVWWLGPTYEPKDARPTFFQAAYVGSRRDPLPGQELSVHYFNFVHLDTWTAAGWAKFSHTRLGEREWTWHCTKSWPVKLPHGHAVIYGAYRKDESTCPAGPPRHFSAHVFLPGVVIAIGEPHGLYETGGVELYESRAKLEALVRGLKPYSPAG
jgi:hypothetical protein